MLGYGILFLLIGGLLCLFYRGFNSEPERKSENVTFLYGVKAHSYYTNLEGRSITIWKQIGPISYSVHGDGCEKDEMPPQRGEYVLLRMKGGGTGKYKVEKINYVVDAQAKWGGEIVYEGRL